VRRPSPRWWLPLLLALAVVAHLAWGGLYWAYSWPRDGLLPFQDNFETGDLRHWQRIGWRQLCCAHSMTVVPDPERPGGQSARFELRRGDPLMRGSSRAEVRLPAAEMHGTYRYRFRVFLPPDWEADPAPAFLVQWHSVADKLLLEAGVSQPLRLATVDDRWIIDNIWDSDWVSRWQGEREERRGGARMLWSGPLERGRWVNWEFVVRWSWQDDGLIEVFKDGQPLLRASGPNTYRDLIAPYMKAGVYVPRWALAGEPVTLPRRVVLIDDIALERR
jgi:Polysaccharide lyase